MFIRMTLSLPEFPAHVPLFSLSLCIQNLRACTRTHQLSQGGTSAEQIAPEWLVIPKGQIVGKLRKIPRIVCEKS